MLFAVMRQIVVVAAKIEISDLVLWEMRVRLGFCDDFCVVILIFYLLMWQFLIHSKDLFTGNSR